MSRSRVLIRCVALTVVVIVLLFLINKVHSDAMTVQGILLDIETKKLKIDENKAVIDD